MNSKPRMESYGFVEHGAFLPVRGAMTNPDRASIDFKDDQRPDKNDEEVKGGARERGTSTWEQVCQIIEDTMNPPTEELEEQKVQRKGSFGMEELGATIDDLDAPDEQHQKESEMNDKIRTMEKFLTKELPALAKESLGRASKETADN